MKYLHKVTKGQRGFTLLEILIAITISGILFAGITATIVQIFNENARATRNMKLVQSVENAGYWINHDGLMTQSIASASGFPLTMQWQDCEFEESNNYQGNSFVVEYDIDISNGNLQRSMTVNSDSTTTTTVAQHINGDADKTFYTFDSSQRLLTFTVTADIDQTSETRVYQIKLRTDANS